MSKINWFLLLIIFIGACAQKQKVVKKEKHLYLDSVHFSFLEFLKNFPKCGASSIKKKKSYECVTKVHAAKGFANYKIHGTASEGQFFQLPGENFDYLVNVVVETGIAHDQYAVIVEKFFEGKNYGKVSFSNMFFKKDYELKRCPGKECKYLFRFPEDGKTLRVYTRDWSKKVFAYDWDYKKMRFIKKPAGLTKDDSKWMVRNRFWYKKHQ